MNLRVLQFNSGAATVSFAMKCKVDNSIPVGEKKREKFQCYFGPGVFAVIENMLK